ncbi:MAG: hypothetical protein HC935_06675 [Pseudanabaena sp. SU_2_4]|nr:hypothetical protein [Pseudanabaena sp. SU_2_4]
MLFPPTDIGSSGHRRSYFTPGTLKAVRVTLVKPVASLRCSVRTLEGHTNWVFQLLGVLMGRCWLAVVKTRISAFGAQKQVRI